MCRGFQDSEPPLEAWAQPGTLRPRFQHALLVQAHRRCSPGQRRGQCTAPSETGSKAGSLQGLRMPAGRGGAQPLLQMARTWPSLCHRVTHGMSSLASVEGVGRRGGRQSLLGGRPGFQLLLVNSRRRFHEGTKTGRSRFTFMGDWPTMFSQTPLRRGFPAQLSPKSVGIGSQAGGLRPEAGWGPAPGTQVRESPPRDAMGLAGARKPPARPCLGRSEIRVPEGSGQRAPTHPALCAQGPEKPVLGVGAWACHSRVVTLWPCRSNCPLI